MSIAISPWTDCNTTFLKLALALLRNIKFIYMKKLSTILIFVFLAGFAFSQNLVLNGDMESWDNPTTPSDWELYDNVTQNTANVHGGTYSAAQMSDASTQKLRQDVFNIVGGQQYTISYYFLDNVTDARTRIWSYWMEDGTYLDDDEEVLRPSEYSVENAQWQHYTVTLTAPLNANEFRFDVRTYKQDGNYGGNIYFDDFSVSGETIIYPEPSNYPTNVVATASGLTIDFSWDESVGTQLPTGYLIYGYASASPVFDVPVDGIAVANDMDWSDDKVTVNVGFGSGSYSFGSLDPNQAYTFIIYPFTNSGDNIDYKTDGTAPSAGASTSNVSQVVYEPFDSDLGVFSQFSVTGPEEWEWASYGEPPGCAKGNGYSGGPVENEDWLISPKLEVENFVSLTLSFMHARNYGTNEGLEIAVSTDYTGTGDPNNASWDYITGEFNFPLQGSWDFNDAGTADITEYASGNTYIAFVYNSTSSDAATWEIDNVEVLGILGTGIDSEVESDIRVYPNPASGFVNIETELPGEVNIYSINGTIVLSSKLESGQNRISVNSLNSGLYFIEKINNNKSRSIEKLTIK